MTTALNMTKENRKELRSLRTQTRRLGRETTQIHKRAEKEIARIEREASKELDGIRKSAANIEKRRLILAGRNSK